MNATEEFQRLERAEILAFWQGTARSCLGLGRRVRWRVLRPSPIRARAGGVVPGV